MQMHGNGLDRPSRYCVIILLYRYIPVPVASVPVPFIYLQYNYTISASSRFYHYLCYTIIMCLVSNYPYGTS